MLRNFFILFFCSLLSQIHENQAGCESYDDFSSRGLPPPGIEPPLCVSAPWGPLELDIQATRAYSIPKIKDGMPNIPLFLHGWAHDRFASRIWDIHQMTTPAIY
jgi:hypothetical protein